MSIISWQFQTTIPNGPAVILNQPKIELDGYDVTTFTLPVNTHDHAVPIQPSGHTGDVIVLVISSSVYDPKVSYTVDGLGISHILDSPHTLLGSGAVSLLNATAPPQILSFSNTLTDPVDIQVLVGRKVP